jgi:hypothetical protein
MNLYTYHQAARLLSLSGRAVIHKRLSSLAARGEPLSVEGGELLQVGARLLITDAGLERLRNFEPRKPPGRPPKHEP